MEAPKFHGGGRTQVVTHREYLCDIYTSPTANTFQIQRFGINPGDAKTFPWLAQLACNYEEYRMCGLVFEFKTMSADALNSTNTALGSVIMATEYNSLLPTFASKYAMENYEFAQSCKPSSNMAHAVECSRGGAPMSELYVRGPSGQNASGDIRMYDLGAFQIATTGMQGTSVNIGELWVSYCCELIKPKLCASLGDAIASAHYFGTGPVAAAPMTSLAPVVSSAPDGRVLFSGDSIGLIIPTVDTVLNVGGMTWHANRSLIFPTRLVEGQFMLTFLFVGTAVSDLGMTTTPTFYGCNAINQNGTQSGNSVPQASWGGTADGLDGVAPLNGTSNSTNWMVSWLIQIATTAAAPNAGMQWPATGITFPTTMTSLDMYVTQVNGDMF